MTSQTWRASKYVRTRNEAFRKYNYGFSVLPSWPIFHQLEGHRTPKIHLCQILNHVAQTRYIKCWVHLWQQALDDPIRYQEQTPLSSPSQLAHEPKSLHSPACLSLLLHLETKKCKGVGEDSSQSHGEEIQLCLVGTQPASGDQTQAAGGLPITVSLYLLGTKTNTRGRAEGKGSEAMQLPESFQSSVEPVFG